MKEINQKQFKSSLNKRINIKMSNMDMKITINEKKRKKYLSNSLLIDKRDIKVSDDNEFVDVLVAIEEEMTAIRELYVGGYISKGVYISETDRLYEKAKIFGV